MQFDFELSEENVNDVTETVRRVCKMVLVKPLLVMHPLMFDQIKDGDKFSNTYNAAENQQFVIRSTPAIKQDVKVSYDPHLLAPSDGPIFMIANRDDEVILYAEVEEKMEDLVFEQDVVQRLVDEGLPPNEFIDHIRKKRRAKLDDDYTDLSLEEYLDQI